MRIDDPNVRAQGITTEVAKKLLADATIAMGKLLDKGVEFSQAVKEAVKDLVKLLGEDRRTEIENAFAKEYKDKIDSDKDLFAKFSNKTDNKFTPQDTKDIWDYAKKEYIDKGRSVNDMLKGVSIDLGLTSKQVLKAFENTKGTKVISDEMFRLQSVRRKADAKVKQYIQDANSSRLGRWARAVPNFFFRKAIFGHGTVGMITHAGMNIFRPTIARIYWNNFRRQFKNSFGAFTDKGMADYEKNMQHLQNDPLFITAKRAGVKVDPTERSDDYTGLKKWAVSQKIMGGGDRGFNALKQFRMDYFTNEYNRLSEAEKADPETLKEIAKIINHSTGTTNHNVAGVINTTVFAPRLELSKWARIVTDPLKALTTIGRWDKATPAEQAASKFVIRKTGEVMATYLTGLAINQSLLWATGSKQSINFTDPTKKDWLKFKMGGETVDASGGIVSTMGFMAHILSIPFLSVDKNGKLSDGKTKADELMKTGWDYATSKASPFASTAKDVITSHDFRGNTMPWSNDKPLNKYAHKLTWKEYLLNSQAPIPIAEASRSMYESMEERGMSTVQIDAFLTGLMKGFISGGTGAKVSTDFSTKEQPTKENFLGHDISEPTDDHIKETYGITGDDISKFKDAREKIRVDKMKELTDYGADFTFGDKPPIHLDLKDEEKLNQQLEDNKIDRKNFDEALSQKLKDIGTAASKEAKSNFTVKEKPKLESAY